MKTKAILVNSPAQAQGIIDKLNRSHGNKLATFNHLAQSNSANSLSTNKNTITVDNNQSTVPAEYKAVAGQLKTGEYSIKPVKTDNGYYVIYILNHPSKGKLANHTAALKQQIVNDNFKNPRFMRKMTKRLLTDANVKIKDPAFKNALNDLTNNSK
nr:peptidylprolyl isomerase [Limosilactobacillus equigenerosi]